MNLSNFRKTGDLSDVTVVVEGHIYKLHKFPLFSRSEYFINILKNQTTNDKVTLDDFPGGKKTFSTVADFCYNLKIDLTKHNIVELRCAADYLQMTGDGNLGSVCDKFLNDCLTTAKLSRSKGLVCALLRHCGYVGDRADTNGILGLCIQALVDCLVKPPSKFSPRSPNGKDDVDTDILKNINGLPLEGVARLMSECRERGVEFQQRCQLIVGYIDVKMKSVKKSGKDDEKDKSTADDKVGHTDLDLVKDTESESTGKTSEKSNTRNNENNKNINLDEIVDRLLAELEDVSQITPYVTITFLTDLTELTTEKCQSKPTLYKIAMDVMKALPADQLATVNPSLLRSSMEQLSKNLDPGNTDKSTSESPDKSHDLVGYEFVDAYMKVLADRGDMTPTQFCELAQMVPVHMRTDHDQLFCVLQTLMENDPRPTPKDQEAMMAVIDFQRLSETALEASLSRGMMPASLVAKSALSLCTKLRADLKAAKEEVETQKLKLAELGVTDRNSNVTGTNASNPTSAVSKVKATDVSRADGVGDIRGSNVIDDGRANHGTFPRSSFRSYLEARSESNLRPSYTAPRRLNFHQSDIRRPLPTSTLDPYHPTDIRTPLATRDHTHYADDSYDTEDELLYQSQYQPRRRYDGDARYYSVYRDIYRF